MHTNASILTFVCEDAPCFPMIHVLETTRIDGYFTLVVTNGWPMRIGWMAYLCCVVHFDLGDLPVAGLCVVLQPGLSGKKATNSEHPHTRQEGEETTLAANIRPGQHRQHFPCVWPPHRLIVQGVLLRLPGPRFQFPVRSDLPSHFCDEAKSPFLHHV